MSASKVTGNGIGIGTVLFVVFLVLKLCGVIGWSWWWVFAPLWAPFALLLLVACIVLFFAFTMALVGAE